jgi:transposase
LPSELAGACQPLLAGLESLTAQIKECDQRLEELADKIAPVARLLTTIPGVGLLTALTFVLTVEDPSRFGSSRTLGAYLGLRPRRDQSGQTDKALPISKCGDPYLRQLLVQCAHRILSVRMPESELRTWGLKLAGRGKAGKGRAVIAVARKLAVLMHRIWVTGEPWDPCHWSRRVAAQQAASEQLAA